MIKMIVATDLNNGIGINGNLPWRIKEDLQHFSKTTIGDGNNVVIMGRNTWESIGFKPLKKRTNIIISRKLAKPYTSNIDKNNENTIFFYDIPNAIDYCKSYGFDNIFIIGGQDIYNYFLHTNDDNTRPHECIITRISKIYECDKYFTDISNLENWKCYKSEKLETKNNEINIIIEYWKYDKNIN
jgi:dihydrofolate reductase